MVFKAYKQLQELKEGDVILYYYAGSTPKAKGGRKHPLKYIAVVNKIYINEGLVVKADCADLMGFNKADCDNMHSISYSSSLHCIDEIARDLPINSMKALMDSLPNAFPQHFV